MWSLQTRHVSRATGQRPGRSDRILRPVRPFQPLKATGSDDGSSSKPRRRSSSKNGNSGEPDVPPPATQIANNLAAGTGRSSSSTSSGASGASSSAPPPAVQITNNLATGSTPAAQVASNMSSQQGTPSSSSSSSSSSGAGPESPPDLLQQGVRFAADAAEEAITQGATAAVGGIDFAANLTQQGLSAAEEAAEEAVRSINTAAQETLNTAAAVVGGAAGAVDGVAAPASSGSRRQQQQARGGATSSADFETVNVRVPAQAWANATSAKGRVRDATLTQDFDEEEVEAYKVKILAAVASLDRGLAANLWEARDVDTLARKLEDAAGAVTLKWTTSRSSPNASTMDKLAGTWRLIYSSGFNGGSLGGSRPGPPAAFVPTVLGQVYQVIDAQAMILDNVVELLLSYGAPRLPFLPPPEPQATPGLRVTLRHTYEVTPPNSVKIVFESTAAKAIGPDLLQSLPQVGLPELPSFLKPPKDFRSATFNVTYLDANMRVTRGDRGELRIYLRDKPLQARLPMDDVDRDYD